jgi:hypothetical protein
LPPPEYTGDPNSCPGHSGNGYCSVEDYWSSATSTGKCPIDCSTYIKWVINTYIKEEIQQDYQNNPKAINEYPYSISLGQNYGVTVDGNPTKGSYSPTEQYECHLENLQPGDLIFFAKKYSSYQMGHVGFYVGDGKLLHASGADDDMTVLEVDLLDYIDYLNNPPAGKEDEHGIYVGAKRFCPLSVPDGVV